MSNPHDPTQPEALDDVDRLFLSRLERAPVPQELTARVLASTIAPAHPSSAVLAWPWTLASLVAIGLLSVVGYQLGAALASSGSLELVTAVFNDFGLVATAPGEVVAALGEVTPWGLLLAAVLSATLLIVAAGNVLAHAPDGLRARRLA